MLNLVNEVASFSIHAAPLVQKYIAKLSFVLKIYLTIFSKFVLAMSEFTLMLVWTLSKLYEFLTKLGFLFILPYRRLPAMRLFMLSGRIRLLSGWGAPMIFG